MLAVSQIIDAAIHETDQTSFVEGSSGTGRAFTIKALIATLRSYGKKWLICGMTKMAAIQYPGEALSFQSSALEFKNRPRELSGPRSTAILFRVDRSLSLA
jgi:hypothetical protein